jgi:endonuclease I
MKKIFTLFLVVLAFNCFAQIPTGYYNTAEGKTGETLRAALRDITTTGHIKVPYTSSDFDVWDAYANTDVRPSPNNTIIWDMYSDIPNGTPAYIYTIYTSQCGSAAEEGDCYAREHLMANSFWGGIDDDANPQYSDLHHLFPADQYVNNRKSNNIVAQTSTPTWTSTNGSKVGPCTYPGYTGTIFEPINEYKGDFARAFFYLAARYMDDLSTWVTTYPSTDAQYIINSTGGNYKQWFVDMLILWHNSDPISQKEIDRNNSIYYDTPQNNRNPFVDHPEYVCEVWVCKSSPVITNITNTPTYPNSSNAVSVSANVTDNVSVASVTLQWCTDGVSFNNNITMNTSAAPNYVSVSSIPDQPASTTVTYKIVATDNEANSTTSLTNSYKVIKNEPTDYSSSFSCGTSTSTLISLTWVDASTSITPDGYLIKGSSVSFADITDPIDGVNEDDALLVKNIAQGAQMVNFTGLVSSTTYYFKIYPFSNSLINIDYKTTPTVPNTSCQTSAGGTGNCAADLIISEYIEGSGNNKYIEISNNTEATIDLSNYKLELYSNGASTATASVTLTGTLNVQTTIVYQNSSASVYGGTATSSAAVNFNGDDAVALFKISSSSYVDIFGRIGEDPGTAWVSGSFTTQDKTLVRNSSVTSGVATNPTAGFPTLATEWTQYTTDDASYLGAHSMDCPSNTAPIIENQEFSINENSPVGSEVGTIVASDSEEDELIFNIISGNTDNAFAINTSSGLLTVNNSSAINYETNPSFSLSIEVSDGNLTSSATITINIEATTGLSPLAANSKIKIYPNPAEDILTIELPENFSAELFSIIGEKLIVTKDKSIDISKLESGVYFVIIKDINNQTIQSKKIIKK